MTDDIINKLPAILREHICSVKRASMDDSKKSFMCESSMKVINFDKIPNEYSRGKGWLAVPHSNDALYISVDNQWYFIEFKNGTIDKSDVFRKIYDSLIMLIELDIIPDFDYARKNINYMLVYNSDKYPQTPPSKNREATYSYVFRLAQTEEKLFDIGKFDAYLFNETHTYTKEEFYTNFILPMEQSEKMAAV